MPHPPHPRGLRTRARRAVAAGLGVLLLAGCAGSMRFGETGFAPALARVLPYAIGVYCMSRTSADVEPPASSMLDEGQRFARIGAGFMIDADGFAVSAGHVTSDCEQLVVKLSDQRVLTAELVGVDTDSDIALLHLELKTGAPPPLGRSAALRPGHWVLAVGEPYGLNRSVAAGIVGGKDRHFGDDPELLFIQSDVALNPGNSGGPMVDSRGDIVGMNMRTVVGAFGAPGVSLSVPIEIVLAIVADLRRNGSIARPHLGAEFDDLLPQVALARGRATTQGALVSSVRHGSLAERMGLQVDDIVVAMNGRAIAHSADLARELLAWRTPAGTRLRVLRNGTLRTLQLSD
jgi:S1-C subfamily serine protease